MAIDYRKKNILVVDDFHEFRASLRFMLQSFGAVSIDGAGTGEAALDFIKNKAYDIILCDYNLGFQQKDGQQILEEIKSRELIKLSTVFIMITAENTTEMIMGVAEYYPDDYLIKPFTKEVLKARIEKAIRKKEDFEIVESAVNRKEYRRAIALCEQQIQKHPPNIFEYLKLEGELCLQSGDYQRAREVYEGVLNIREIPWAQIGMGRTLFCLEEFEKAGDIFQGLVQENALNVVAYDWLAKIHIKLNNQAEAQRLLQEATDISPKSVKRQETLGEVALQNQDWQISEKAFKTAIECGKHSCFKSPAVYTGLAKVLVEKKEPDKALNVLNDISKEFTGDESAAFQASAMKGVVYRTMERKEESARCFQEAARLFLESEKPIPPEMAMDVAKSCFDAGEKDSGLKLIQDIVRNNHEDEVLLKKVQTVFNEADLGEEGSRFIATTRKEVVQINNRGVKLVEAGKLDEAIASFEEAAQKLPGNKTILANTARALLMHVQKNGKDKAVLKRAMVYIKSLQKVDPAYNRIPGLLALFEELYSS
jgi:tetratricopeptide (TPR) repeat protein